jgi:hypothetical protein
MKNNRMDMLLKSALRTTEAPDAELLERLKQLRRRNIGDKTAGESISNDGPVLKKNTKRRSLRTVIIAAIIVMLLSTAALAAQHFLNAGEVADLFTDDQVLSAMLNREDAIEINDSAVSGDYTFTLLAIVSGKDINDYPNFRGKNGETSPHDGLTYLVASVKKTDGSPMPSMDDAYAPSFHAASYIKGFEPRYTWSLNISGSSAIVDGIEYHLFECGNLEWFADQVVYLGISMEPFPDFERLLFDEKTGEITTNPAYTSPNALFVIPLDKSKADPQKAEQHLDKMIGPFIPDDINNSDMGLLQDDINWDKATPIASTVKELYVNAYDYINYSIDYKNTRGSIIVRYKDYFVNNKTAQSAIVYTSTDEDDNLYAVRLRMDENGMITGMIVVPE